MGPQRHEVQSTDGMPIAYWTSGRGSPLLTVPGAASTHEAWEGLRERLDAHFNVDGVYDAWLKDYVGMPEDVAEEVKASPVGASMRPFARHLPREMAAHLAWRFDARTLRGLIPLLEGALGDFSVRALPGQGQRPRAAGGGHTRIDR